MQTADDIAHIDPAAWDAQLDPDDLQATHRFVLACQRSGIEDAAYRHVFIRHGARTVATAVLSQMHVRLELLSPSPLRSVVGQLRRLSSSFLRLPVAFCGLPVSFGKSCVRIRPGWDPSVLTTIVARELDEWAAATGVNLVCFKEFSPSEEAVVRSLVQSGCFSAASLPSCHIDIRWPSFDEYIASFRAGYRRQLLASLRLRERARLDVSVVNDYEALCPRLFDLYCNVMDRAPYQLERLNLSFFAELCTAFRGESAAVLVERDGHLLAAAILLYGKTEVTFLLAGIDYALNERFQAYPNLVIEVVAEAIRRGAQRLEMGQTSYLLKGRLGALTTPRTLYLRHRRPVAHGVLRSTSRFLFPAATTVVRRVFRETGSPGQSAADVD